MPDNGKHVTTELAPTPAKRAKPHRRVRSVYRRTNRDAVARMVGI